MRTQIHALTSPAPGSSHRLCSLHYGDPKKGRKVYIQAALHADEPPGLLVAYHLRRRLAELESGGKIQGEIVLVPMANPIGLGQRILGRGLGRFEQASGENFNRHYAELSAAAWTRLAPTVDSGQTPSLAEVRAALREACAEVSAASELASLRKTLLSLSIDADWVIDLHCDSEAIVHLYTADPVWPQVEPLARLLGSRVNLLATESGGEPFDEACSMVWARLNRLWQEQRQSEGPWPDACVALTVELRGEADVSHELAEADAQALIDYLTHQGLIEGPSPVLPEPAIEPLPLAGSVPVKTPSGGVLVHRPLLGQSVRKGQCVAEVINPLDGSAIELCAENDGILYARETGRVVHAGMSVCKVAGSEAVRTGSLLSA